jgi:hypothetical protein
MTRHIENVKKLHTFAPALIDQIAELVGSNMVQTQYDVVTVAYAITTMPDYVPPTVERRRLLDVVNKLRVAQDAIGALPGMAGWRLRDDATAIAKTAEQAAQLAEAITARRSNGSPKAHTVALQKQVAAEGAFDLLKGRKLDNKPEGDFNCVATLLFELGTGRALTKRAMEKACARVLSAH